MSMVLQVNKAEFGQDNFALLPEGDYELELIGVKVEPFAKSGNYTDVNKYSLTWKITENNEVGVGRRLFDNIAIIEHWRNAAKTKNFKLDQFLTVLGIEPDENGTIELPDADTILDSEWVTGASVVVSEDKTGKYDDRNEVNRYLTPERFEKSKKKPSAPGTTATSASATSGGVKNNGLFV